MVPLNSLIQTLATTSITHAGKPKKRTNALSYLFSFIDNQSLMTTVPLVCRAFHIVTQEDSQWEARSRTKFSQQHPGENIEIFRLYKRDPSWKEIYKILVNEVPKKREKEEVVLFTPTRSQKLIQLFLSNHFSDNSPS